MDNEFNNIDLREEEIVPLERDNFNAASVKKDFSRIGFGFVLFSGITLLVSLIIQVVVLTVSEEFYNSHLFLNLVTPVSLYIFALPVLIAFWRDVKPTPPEKRKMRLAEWIVCLIVGVGLMYIGALAGNNVMSFISGITGHDYQNGLNTVVDGNMWVTAFFVVIVAPIGEEYVFRKMLIDRTGRYGCIVSAIVSGLVFGLMHGNLYQLFYATLLGLVLGYIYYNTGRLVYCIALHATINFIGSVVSSYLGSMIEGVDLAGDIFVEDLGKLLVLGIYSILIYVAMACAVILPLVFRKKLCFGKGEIDIPRGKRVSSIFKNAGMICMVAFYVFEILISLIPN